MRPSLRTIARAAGVSVSTVSLALRGLAKVDPETKKRIDSEAARIGYVRDPQLSHALSFARKTNKPVYRETLALLVDWPPGRLDEMPWLQELGEGAANRAAELGYAIETVLCRASAREQRAQSRQMSARGIRGLIVTPGILRTPYTLDFAWSQFAAVEIGQTLGPPALLRVFRDSADDYAGMFGELRLRGYRRIGLATTDHEEIRRHWAVLSAYLTFHHRNPGQVSPPALPSGAPKDFHRWLSREKPDVIVVNGSHMRDWLRETGWKLPGDIGLCRIDAFSGHDSGLRPDYAGMGRAAVGALAANLERGEIGPPSAPPTLCIPNAWHEGTTLRARPADAPPLAIPLRRLTGREQPDRLKK
ncbi:MAG: LacI family DNA-binding transcriptional regulator [Opitutaceae bacterium]|jgi:LacI family transcriptional regulator